MRAVEDRVIIAAFHGNLFIHPGRVVVIIGR